MLREFYRRNLPHLLPIGATFFVTFRLKGSMPKTIGDKLAFERDQALVDITFRKDLLETERQSLKYAIEKKYWQAFNDVLDTIKEGPHHLKIPELAQIVVDRMTFYDGVYYSLISYVVMSNHVHALLDFSLQLEKIDGAITEDNYKQLESVMKLIKGSSAKYCNDWLKEHKMSPLSPFWTDETYDRYMRNEKHQEATINYILNNPVKAGLCKRWQDYPFAWRR